MLRFVKVVLLTITLLSMDSSLSLPRPFSQPRIRVLVVFLNILLVLPTTIIIVLRITGHLTPRLVGHPPRCSHSRERGSGSTGR